MIQGYERVKDVYASSSPSSTTKAIAHDPHSSTMSGFAQAFTPQAGQIYCVCGYWLFFVLVRGAFVGAVQP